MIPPKAAISLGNTGPIGFGPKGLTGSVGSFGKGGPSDKFLLLKKSNNSCISFGGRSLLNSKVFTASSNVSPLGMPAASNCSCSGDRGPSLPE